ncbi:YkgJ family cysteine cluster protein [Desulfocurvus sp. DL9XJH121]
MNEAERISKRTFCERCGTCCLKGGPALHKADLRLFESGILNYGNVYTLRAGEMVQEQIKGGLAPLAEEIVKIRGVGENRWTCVLYDNDAKACTIYEERPEECRIFNCWAPEDLAAMYAKDRLTRAHIVPPDSALAELVRTHEAEVPYAALEPLAYAFLDGDRKAGAELVDKVVWDAAFRSAFAEKTNTGPELEFLFGRPLNRTLVQYGLEVAREADGYTLRKQS